MEPKGTPVEITLPSGRKIVGTVLTADNWGVDDAPNWYIELSRHDGGYLYYKQGEDSGEVAFG